MQICNTVDEVRATRWSTSGGKLSWGFVPTMGFLHEGHLSLVRRARGENARLAASIFVNPTQFAPNEDFDAYPRDTDRDLRLLQNEGVDLVFLPDDSTMYPPWFQTTITVAKVSQPLEGASRPTHFAGVVTVVAKLFNIVQPYRAYFGQKDAQQVVVVKRMVEDLNINVQIVVCPIVREADGLAMSSRNARLNEQQRAAAPTLYQALSAAREALNAGERDGSNLRALMTDVIKREPLARTDYVSVADPQTLEELEFVEDGALLSGAVFVGPVRLIDNILI